MNVTITQGDKPKVFVPFTITINVDTLAEAVALRALHGGMSSNDADHIASRACAMPSTGEAISDVVQRIARPIEGELREQGVFNPDLAPEV